MWLLGWLAEKESKRGSMKLFTLTIFSSRISCPRVTDSEFLFFKDKWKMRNDKQDKPACSDLYSFRSLWLFTYLSTCCIFTRLSMLSAYEKDAHYYVKYMEITVDIVAVNLLYKCKYDWFHCPCDEGNKSALYARPGHHYVAWRTFESIWTNEFFACEMPLCHTWFIQYLLVLEMIKKMVPPLKKWNRW